MFIHFNFEKYIATNPQNSFKQIKLLKGFTFSNNEADHIVVVFLTFLTLKPLDVLN